MKVFVLNREVERELLSDEILFCMFYLLHQKYDVDIDPLHNPDWVERAKQEEKRLLSVIKKEKNAFENMFKQLTTEK